MYNINKNTFKKKYYCKSWNYILSIRQLEVFLDGIFYKYVLYFWIFKLIVLGNKMNVTEKVSTLCHHSSVHILLFRSKVLFSVPRIMDGILIITWHLVNIITLGSKTEIEIIYSNFWSQWPSNQLQCIYF